MANKLTKETPAQPFEIHPKNTRIVLDPKRSAQVDFEIRYRGSEPSPHAQPGLGLTPRRTWLQRLAFWRRLANPREPARLGWLGLPVQPLPEGLLKPDQVTPLTVSIDVPDEVLPGEYDFRLELLDARGRLLAQSDPVTIEVKSLPFTIQVISPRDRRFTLLFARQKDCQFRVTNTTPAPLEGRVRLAPHRLDTPGGWFRPPGRSLDLTWLSFAEQAEQFYPSPDEDGRIYHVRVKAPPKALPGVYQFSLDAAEASNPDENFTPGPPVTFTIQPFPWALVITLLVLLLLGAGAWLLRRPSLVATSSLGGDAASSLAAPTFQAPVETASPDLSDDQAPVDTDIPDTFDYESFEETEYARALEIPTLEETPNPDIFEVQAFEETENADFLNDTSFEETDSAMYAADQGYEETSSPEISLEETAGADPNTGQGYEETASLDDSFEEMDSEDPDPGQDDEETTGPDEPADQPDEEEPQPDIFAGGLVTYTITVTNQKGLPVLGRSPARSRDVGELVDTLGDGAAFETGAPEFSPDCSAEGQTVTCRLPETERIQGGQDYSFTLVARVDPAHAGDLAHTLRLGNVEKTFTAPVKRQSGLKLTWLENTDVASQDQALSYRLSLENEGPSQSGPITLVFKPIQGGSEAVASFLTLEPVDNSPACEQVRQVVCETSCRQAFFVKCDWDSLAPGDSQEIAIQGVPGPAVSGEILSTVELAEGGQTISDAKTVIVNAVHGLGIDLNARKELDNSLVYTITVTNGMNFAVSGTQVDFRLPDLLVNPVALGDITPLDGSAITPDRCWVSVEPPRSDPTDGEQAAQPDQWAHCAFESQALEAGSSFAIEVKTIPAQEGTYHSYVLVDSQGFKSQAPNTTVWTERIEGAYALRLDGSRFLSVALDDLAPFRDNFEAQVRFYYDGSSQGRILSIGDFDGSPGWSINLEGRLLTLRFSQAAEPLRCILEIPADDGDRWLTARLRVENLGVAFSVQAREEDPWVDCGSFAVDTQLEYAEPGPLIVGGPAGEGVYYQGAVVFVQFKDLQGEIIASWEFGADEAVGSAQVRDSSGSQQDFELSGGPWAWAPSHSTVLMPIHITSDSSWKASSTAGSDWISGQFEDGSWPYAWDMPVPAGWVPPPSPDARWIWAAQPYANPSTPGCSCNCSCKGLFSCSCGCNCTTNQPGFPAVGIVFLRKTFDLPANPVEASLQAAVDDNFSIFTNQVAQGACTSQPGNACFTQLQPYDLTSNLHVGDNVIAIQATNTYGPAGVLLILDIDFYQTYTFLE